MSIPSPIGLPQELKLGEVDFSLPSDSRSYQVNVQPSNVPSVTQTGISVVSAASGPPTTTPQFSSQTLYFDLPAGNSPSTFIDNRFTTISFKANLAVTTTFAGAFAQTGFQRSGGYSWIDRMYITAQNGNIVEDITEYGLVNDLMVATQLNTATRDTLATQYGFLSATTNESQGHQWNSIAQTTAAAAAGETFSYSMPLVSSLIGVTADRFFNIGRTNKLQVAIQTCSELPISIINAGAITAGVFTVVLSDFVLQCNYVDVGPTALAMIDATLPDKKAYIHGTTYKTSSISMAGGLSGSQSLLAGIRGSSIKSLFCRFQDMGAVSTTNSTNGKYDSKNPLINAINFNIGGQRLPNNPVNALLHPSRAFRALQMASGSYNNSQFQSAIIPVQYMKLAVGGTAATIAAPLGTTQAFQYNLGSTNSALCQFIYGEDLEIVARRGLMSGMNCNSAPVFVEFNIASAVTNPQTLFVHALGDVVYIHDVATGDVQVRM